MNDTYTLINLPLFYDVEKNNIVDIKWLSGGGIAVTAYESIRSLNIPDECNIDLLVVDEAHYVKIQMHKEQEM